MLRSLPNVTVTATRGAGAAPLVTSPAAAAANNTAMEHSVPTSLPALTTSSPSSRSPQGAATATASSNNSMSPTIPTNGASSSSPPSSTSSSVTALVPMVEEGPQINWFGSKPLRWDDVVDEVILKRLYPTSSRMTVSVLAGGFSSGTVLAIRSYDQSDVREVATVVKIDTKALIAQEFKAIKRVKEILGNAAPQIIDCVDSLGPPGGEKGGIKFRYGVVNGGRRKPKRLLDLFEELTPQSLESILQVINEIYCDLLDPWHSAAKPEFFPLYAYYFEGFDQNNGEGKKFSQVWVDPNYLKRFITYAMSGKGTDAALHYKKTKGFLADYEPYNDETFLLPGCDQKFANIGHLFERPDGVPYLKTIPPVRLYSSYAHGDANLQNFLHDERGNVWVVDFLYTTNKQHVLRDPCKMWACIMFVATEIASDKQFAQAVLISRTLARARDLHQPLPEAIGITNMHLQYIYKILLCMWGHLGRIVKDRSHATQFQLGLVSECMRFFLYECRNTYCKRWALVTAVLLMESVLAQTKRVHDIRPDWITVPNSLCKGKLGMTRCPGNKHYSRIKPSSIPPLATPGPGASVTGQSNHGTMNNNSTASSASNTNGNNGNSTAMGTARPLSVAAPTPSSSHRDSSHNNGKGNRPRLKSTEEYLEDEDAAAAMIANNDDSRVPLAATQAVLPPMSLPTTTIAPSITSAGVSTPLASSSSIPPQATRPPSLGTQRISPPQPLTLNARSLSDDGTTTITTGSAGNGSASSSRTSPTLSTLPSHPQSPLSPTLPLPTDVISSSSSSSSASSPSPLPERKRTSKLEREVAKLKEVGVTHTLFLVHDSEFADMGLSKQGVQLAVDNAGISQTSVAVPPGEIRMAHAIQVVKLAIRILCERPENKLAIVTKSGKHRAGVLAACILCAFGCSPKDAINMVRATRGASAIGRGAREQVIAKFDLAWKNHIITQILMEDDSMLDRRVVTSGPGPSPSPLSSSSANSSSTTGGSGLTIPAVVGMLEPSYNAMISSGSISSSGIDDGSGKGQEWTPEGEERTAMRREWRDPTKGGRGSLNVFEERKQPGSSTAASSSSNSHTNNNGGTTSVFAPRSSIPSSSMASPVKGTNNTK